MRESAARLWLLAIVGAGVALRAFRLGWGLPEYGYPDGVMYFVRPAARLVALGEWNPGHFVHPPLLVYLTALVFAGWSLVTGQAVAGAGPAFYTQFATLVLLGRILSVAVSALAIVVLYDLARRLLGRRAALLAAAVFALAPGQVLEAHRNNPDAPLILMTLVASLIAVVARDGRRRGLLVVAFVAAGLAGGFKYNGPAAAAVPAWVALTWPEDVSLGRRLGWIVLGGVVTLGADALACLAAFFDWERSWTTASAVIRYSYVVGMPGVDLSGHGWVYTRYLYALIVSLPYVMGWAAHVAALVGLVVLVRSAPRAAGVVLAFVVPFYVIMGGATAVVPRYYLPLGPFLAIAAGAALDRGLEGRRRWLGVAAVVLVLGYTGALTLSQCRRLGLGPQRAVAALVADEAHRTSPPLAVAYPHILVLYYDAIRPLVEPIPGVKMVYYPAEYQNIRHETGDTPPEAERLARERRWIEEKDVRVVILPSWVENGVWRERPDGATAGFYRHLADGSLGFHLAGDFRTRYWTEGLYTWAEPMLDTHWETALVGYRVFVRSAEPR